MRLQINRRTFLTSAGLTIAAVSAPKTLKGQETCPTVVHPSIAVQQAALASAANAYRAKGTTSGSYSLYSAVRLMSAMFEDRRETGRTIIDETHLLANKTTVLQYIASNTQRNSWKVLMAGVGLPDYPFPDVDSLSMEDRQAGITQVQQIGLAQMYRNEMLDLAANLPGAAGAAWHHSLSRPTLKNVASSFCKVLAFSCFASVITGDEIGAACIALVEGLSC